jgi:adenosylmethionine-8-amino-7-oxononanoate aminotransferase
MKQDNTDHVFYRSQVKVLPEIDYGKGIYFYDKSGKRYIDGTSGALISNLGHGDLRIAEAYFKQAKKVEFVHGTQFSSSAVKEVAQFISDIAPGDLNRVYFVSGGSEAIETAIKLARGYHVNEGNVQKHKIVSRWQSYHGATLGALSCGGRSGDRHLYIPLLLNFPHIVPCYCYRCPFKKDPKNCNIECAWDLERVILQENPDHISAFIAEPIVGATLGAVPAHEKYLSIIKQICDKYNVLLIADEVMTSVGRTGKWFGIEHYGVVPDMIVGSKGVAAGYYPTGFVIVRENIFQSFKKGPGKFAHGFTYQGNPLSGAVCLKVLNIIKEENLVQHVHELGIYLMTQLEELKRKHSIIGDCRGKGLMTGIEFVKDKKTKEPFDESINLNRRLVDEAFLRGLIIYPGASGGMINGKGGNAIMVAPSFIITKEQLDELLSILDETITTVEKQIAS